jgi:mannosyltransferase
VPGVLELAREHNVVRQRPRKKRARPIPEETSPAAPARARQRRLWRAGMFFVILVILAVALRAANLTAQSLWADEGNSVRLTERPLSLVIAAARADVHPPGYYILLWLWAKVWGQSETSVRSLSVVIGVAVVLVVYLLGQRWFGPRAGWLGAFCAAVSPFQIAYSQEVRMYILVALFGALSAYAFARWIEGGGSRQRTIWSAVYVLAAAGGLWTHYSFPVVIAALNIAWLVWWIGGMSKVWHWGEGSARSAGIWWLCMQVAVALLFLPWTPTAWAKIWGYGSISERYTASFVVAQALKLLSVGETVPDDDLTRWLTVGIVGLALFGAWGGVASFRTGTRRSTFVQTVMLILAVLAPAAMMVALALGDRPAYRPKFFLAASPAFCTLVGGGIALLERPSGRRRTMTSQLWLLLAMGLVGLGAARSLRNYYFDPAYARTNYRGIAETITRQERAGDAILLDAPNQWEVFTYYYHGSAPVYPLCRSRPCSEEQASGELEEIAAQHGRMFVLYWATAESDPERIVERWLEEHAFKASDTWYGDVRFAIYAVRLRGDQPMQPMADVRLGEAIALRGYALSPQQVSPGDILEVTLFWEALQVPPARYKVFVHLVDLDGQIVAQADGEPGDGMHLTTGWQPTDGVFADRYGVLVPDSAGPGDYQVWVGMYDVSGAPRLPISVQGAAAGDAFSLAMVTVR